MKIVTRDELKALLDQGANFELLEALPEKYYRQGHLPGARCFPHDATETLARSLLTNPQAQIVVYCASATCRNSEQAAQALRAMGYADVRVYAGGKADWLAAGLPLER